MRLRLERGTLFHPHSQCWSGGWTLRTIPRDVAKEAYDAARAFVKTELHGSQLEEILELEQYTTVEDVRAIVEQAKARYEKCSQGRKGILKYLTKFSARIMYFGQVLDTLAQHHPEYVALAWGSLKFVFMVILAPLL